MVSGGAGACMCLQKLPPPTVYSPADQVGEAAGKACAKDGIAREHGPFAVQPIHRVNRVHRLNFRLQDDGHDDAIDGHGLAENDAAK